MNTVPEWRVVGDWFDICSCDIPCPCEFAQAPTNNACQGLLAWHVREGDFGEVRLDGFNLLALGAFEGNIWAGEAKVRMGLFIDERADERQREALQISSGGRLRLAGSFAPLSGRCAASSLSPSHLKWPATSHPGGLKFGSGCRAAEALTGPTTPPGKRVQTINPPGSEVGPGQVATWGRSLEVRTEGFGFGLDRRKPVEQAHPVRLDRPDRVAGAALARPPASHGSLGCGRWADGAMCHSAC